MNPQGYSRRIARVGMALLGWSLLSLARLLASDQDLDKDGKDDFWFVNTHTNVSVPPATSYTVSGIDIVLAPGVSFMNLVGPQGTPTYGGFGATVGADVFPPAELAEKHVAFESYVQTSSYGFGSSQFNLVAWGSPYFAAFRIPGPKGVRYAWVYMGGGFGPLIDPSVRPENTFHYPVASGLMPEGATSLTLPASLVAVRTPTLDERRAIAGKLVVTWSGKAGSVLERTASLSNPDWKTVQTGGQGNLVVDPKASADGDIGFYRVR